REPANGRRLFERADRRPLQRSVVWQSSGRIPYKPYFRVSGWLPGCMLRSAERSCGFLAGGRMIEVLVRHVGNRIKYGPKARGTFYYGGSSIICQGLRFLGILISTRLIAADEFGRFATAIMLVGLCGLAKEV